jgi:glycosyltransferase involved in cell wall biosynthesis
MRIVYIYQYFTTPKGSWGTRAYEFARRWVQLGHQVTIVTSVYDKSDLRPTGLIDRFDIDGIDVRVVNVRLSNKHGGVHRAATFLEFMTLATWLAATLPSDVVIASSGPLTVGIPGVLSKFLGRRKLVFEMRDIFSEGALQVGVVKSKLFFACLEGAEQLFCRCSDAVVALSPGIAQWVKQRCPAARVFVVPNAADNELFGAHGALPKDAGTTRIIFSGTIGVANNCGLILDAAEILMRRGVKGTRIELIGDGKERPKLEEQARQRGLINVQFRNLMPKLELARELASADIALLVLQPIPVFDTVSPNKLFDGLAAGLPVVQTTQGWIRELLALEDCGLTVRGDDPAGLADAVARLAQDPDLRARMGANARRVARERFDRGLLAEQMLAGLRVVCSNEAASA